MRQPFDNLGAVGVNLDEPPWQLPPEAWSRAVNFRMRDGAVEKFRGQQAVFSTPLGQPFRLFPISTGINYFWVYAGTSDTQDEIWATDGTSHSNISPASLTAAPQDLWWTGGAFNGFMVLANATNDPLSWVPGLGNQLVVLANWDTTVKADVIRPFRGYLMSYRVTESGSYNPRLIRWSNSATPGNLPTSYDYTDPDNDSGRFELGQTLDRVVDSLPLRDINVVYKENYTWAQQWVGGNANPFIWRQVFSFGMLSENCVAAFRGKHCVITTDDVLIHDLNQVESIIDKRTRRSFFNSINPSAISQVFVVPNHVEREMWFCYPEAGHDYANVAMVWNWQENTIYYRDLGGSIPHAASGILSGSSTTFDALVGSFDSQVGAFDEQNFNPSITSILMASPGEPPADASSVLLQADNGGDFAGNAMTGTVTREAIPLGDVLRWKKIKRIFPKVIGAAGDTLKVYVGVRARLEDPISWSAPKDFVVGTDLFVNFLVTGRIIGVRFEHEGAGTLRLFGFDVEYDPAGYY